MTILNFLRIEQLQKIYLLWPVLLGLAAAYMLSGYLDGQPQDMKYMSSASSGKTEPQTAGADQQSILKANIFRLETPAGPAGPQHTASSSPLNWTLLAVLKGSENLVLVSAEGGYHLVSAGEQLLGWTLTDLSPDSASWSSASKTETTRLWQEQEDRLQSSADQVRNREISSASSISRSQVAPVLNDPNRLLRMARFSPYPDGDNARGFQMNAVQPDSLLERLGFRSGDVLLRIDGLPVNSPEKLLKAYSRLSRSSLVTMDILRQEQNMSFQVEIN
ncbi:MAG: PDZ domain-containing protein [Desulfonatronovibrionaceae bacterium]